MEDTGRRKPAGPVPEGPPPGATPVGRPPPAPLSPSGLPSVSGTAATGAAPSPPYYVDDASLEPGTLLGKYQIIRQLGSGGMGSVYEALHTGISKPVALKTLASRLAVEPNAHARFLREAASASRLDHPHVVDVTDFGSDAGITYLVMELLRGEDLGATLAREPDGINEERTADVMLAVCAGVFAAHQAGVVHRDLKPQNIFLARTSLGDIVPKVLDFGISKLLDEQMSQTLTGTGTVMGTTPYLSPEQVSGHPVDARSDQYTLGVILYECVTGRRPHDGDTLFTIMRSIAEGRFLRPRELRPDLAPSFEQVILRAMSFSPDRRYESVHALGQALLPFASQKPRLLWSDYFGTERGSVSTAPLPASTPVREPRGPERTPGRYETPGRDAAGNTGTKRRPSHPRSAYVSDYADVLPPRRTGRNTVLVLLLLTGLAAAGWWYLGPTFQRPYAPPPSPAPTVLEPPPVVAPPPKAPELQEPAPEPEKLAPAPAPTLQPALPPRTKTIKKRRPRAPTGDPSGGAPILD